MSVEDSCVLWFTTTVGVDGERPSDCIDFIFGINGHIGRTGTPLLCTMEFFVNDDDHALQGLSIEETFCISLVSILRTRPRGILEIFVCAAFFFFPRGLGSIGVLLATCVSDRTIPVRQRQSYKETHLPSSKKGKKERHQSRPRGYTFAYWVSSFLVLWTCVCIYQLFLFSPLQSTGTLVLSQKSFMFGRVYGLLSRYGRTGEEEKKEDIFFLYTFLFFLFQCFRLFMPPVR